MRHRSRLGLVEPNRKMSAGIIGEQKMTAIWRKIIPYLLPAALIAALALFLAPQIVHAQGCAMCYQSAASSGARLIRALKSGILVLVIPPLCLLGLFARLTYLRRNYFGSSTSADESATDTRP